MNTLFAPLPDPTRRPAGRAWPAALVLILSTLVLSPAVHALDYRETRQIMNAFLAFHCRWNTFDDELSRRTLDQLIHMLDRGKLYLLKGDVERFKTAYADKLDDFVRQGDWTFLESMLNTQKKRYLERLPVIESLIDQDQDFTREEFLYPADERRFLDTAEQLDDRWRREIKFHKLQLRRVYSREAAIRNRLHARFARNRRTLEERTLDDRCALFLRAFAASLDPHCNYLTPLAYENLQIALKLHLAGIGTVISQSYGITSIRSLVPGGPAEKTGQLKAGDVILAVGQGTKPAVEITDEPLDRVVQLIRGRVGTKVRLLIRRKENGTWKRHEVTVTRADVKVKNRTASGRLFRVEEHPAGKPVRTVKVGVIALPSFYGGTTREADGAEARESTSADVKRWIDKLRSQGMEALILDLRNNGGGLMSEAINTAGLFFDSGPVLQVRQKNVTTVHSDTDDHTVYAGPLLILVNRVTASASEIVSAAIQDYGRGIIVGGTHTFGKGTVQSVKRINPVRIPTGGALKVTVSQFFRITGATTQFAGVTPDLDLPDPLEVSKIGERFLHYPLQPTKLPALEFKHFDDVAPFLDRLRDASRRRVAADPEFQKIVAELAKYRKQKNHRIRISLKSVTEPEPPAHPPAPPPSNTPQLDLQLGECLAVAADYVQLEHGRPCGKVTLPEMKPSAGRSP